MNCTPYPATYPCADQPPVTVNPYRPTPPDAAPVFVPFATLPKSEAWVAPRIEDELPMAQPVPEPSAWLLLSLAVGAVFMRRRRS